jgi:hypothetical protein
VETAVLPEFLLGQQPLVLKAPLAVAEVCAIRCLETQLLEQVVEVLLAVEEDTPLMNLEHLPPQLVVMGGMVYFQAVLEVLKLKHFLLAMAAVAVEF